MGLVVTARTVAKVLAGWVGVLVGALMDCATEKQFNSDTLTSVEREASYNE